MCPLLRDAAPKTAHPDVGRPFLFLPAIIVYYEWYIPFFHTKPLSKKESGNGHTKESTALVGVRVREGKLLKEFPLSSFFRLGMAASVRICHGGGTRFRGGSISFAIVFGYRYGMRSPNPRRLIKTSDAGIFCVGGES